MAVPVEAAGDFDVPVTVKCRIGWESETVVEFAQAIEEADAAALCVHGRTRSQMYAGKADWDAIARVRQAVKLPLIANGDVSEPEDAVRILEATGADACMIGRASFGNPWIFARAEAALRGKSGSAGYSRPYGCGTTAHRACGGTQGRKDRASGSAASSGLVYQGSAGRGGIPCTHFIDEFLGGI